VTSFGTDNTNEEMKLAVRRWLGRRVDGWRVLDLYCGEQGRMYQGIWSEAIRYFGVDKYRPHNLAPTARMSAEKASQQMNLADWNLFDVDCYSSPWAVARMICKRRPPGRYGMALTSGEARGLRGGDSNEIIRTTIGASAISDLRLLGRYQDLIIKLMIRSLGEMPGVTLQQAAMAKTARGIVYIGLIMDKA
jgi:hypothetical protein